MFSLLENMQSDWLPSLCVYTPLSLVTDPLCYIDLTFVERPFAKLNYVNLHLLSWHCVARLDLVMSSLKNQQMTTWPFEWYRTCNGWYNRNVRNNASKRHQKSSFWELTVTVCGKKRHKHTPEIVFIFNFLYFSSKI